MASDPPTIIRAETLSIIETLWFLLLFNMYFSIIC